MASSTLQILPVDPGRRPSSQALRAVSAALERGELVLVPTETVYGLAADPRVPGAMDSLYRGKGRPGEKPVAMMGARADQFEGLNPRFSREARRLADAFWPGPLTLVLPAAGGYVGFRVPDHPVAAGVIDAFGAPLAVSSANRSGHPPARTVAEAVHSLGPVFTVALDAGGVTGGVPSTVVRVEGSRVEILREGGIQAEAVYRMAGASRSNGVME